MHGIDSDEFLEELEIESRVYGAICDENAFDFGSRLSIDAFDQG